MPSKRRQHNIRLSDDQDARFEAVRARMQALFGLDLSVTDVFAAALIELEKKYPAEPAPKPKRPRKSP